MVKGEGNDNVGIAAAADAAGVGAVPGLQDQGSDQVDNHPEGGDNVGDGVVVVGQGGGAHPYDPRHRNWRTCGRGHNYS